MEVRLALERHREIVEGYGGTFDPTAPFTRSHAEAAIRFVEEQDYAWVIDAGRVIGHVRFHGLVRQDKRAALAIGIDDPAYLGKGFGAEAIRLALATLSGVGFIAGATARAGIAETTAAKANRSSGAENH